MASHEERNLELGLGGSCDSRREEEKQGAGCVLHARCHQGQRI